MQALHRIISDQELSLTAFIGLVLDLPERITFILCKLAHALSIDSSFAITNILRSWSTFNKPLGTDVESRSEDAFAAIATTQLLLDAKVKILALNVPLKEAQIIGSLLSADSLSRHVLTIFVSHE